MKKEGCQKGELELCGSTRFCSSVKEVKSVPIAPPSPQICDAIIVPIVAIRENRSKTPPLSADASGVELSRI